MSHNRKISVIGLGYVGLPVAVAFGKQQRVIGFDINTRRINELLSSVDMNGDIKPDDLRDSLIAFTSVPAPLQEADFHIIAVPTPVDEGNRPDLSPILDASRIVGVQLKPRDIVVYESTVYPGATMEECVPVLEKHSGLMCGQDFFVGYSPERINPGDKEHTFETVIKVVSGQDESTLNIIAAVYASVVKAGVYLAPSIKVAEAGKVIENTQRDLNIALMNELALIFNRMDIDTGDVLACAGTKWNFLPFRPGLVGGHCIGVDPYYLTYKASVLGYIPQVILAGRKINDDMGNFVVQELIRLLIQQDIKVKGSIVTILGFTFKEDVPDTRNTRVADIVLNLQDYGVKVQVYDPLANSSDVYHEYGINLMSQWELDRASAVVLAVPHQSQLREGWEGITRLLAGNIVMDIKGCLPREEKPEGVVLWRL